MRLIDAEPFDFNKVVIPDGGPNFMRGYGLGAKHVCDEIAAAPTVEAVPLDMLCDWLAGYAAPPRIMAKTAWENMPQGASNYETHVQAWKYQMRDLMKYWKQEESKG